MNLEIERKYLVTAMNGVELPEGLPIDQGYLNPPGGTTVRVRTKGSKGYLTMKLAPEEGETGGGAIVRREFEYEIPHEDARALLAVALARLRKTRYTLPGGVELDIFHGPHEGLILAEYESPDGSQPGPVPGLEWREVTSDPRYSNAWIARNGIPS